MGRADGQTTGQFMPINRPFAVPIRRWKMKNQIVGLVAADDRTRAKHRFKFRAVGSSTQAFRHSFAVRTVGDWNSFPSHVVEQSTTASFKAELSRLTWPTCAP